MLFAAAALSLICFGVAVVMRWMGLTLAFLFLSWGLLSVAVPLPRLPGLLRLGCRSFPALTPRVEAWIRRMEFERDLEEARS